MDRMAFFVLAMMVYCVVCLLLGVLLFRAIKQERSALSRVVLVVGVLFAVPTIGFVIFSGAAMISDNTSFVQKQTATEQASNWRAEVLTKYLHHEQVPRKDMWWLDVSSGLVCCEPYITIFCEAEGISASDYTPVVLWREKMYPRLYEDFVGWLPPPDK